MNHCVPDFEIEMDDDEYPILFSSGFLRPKKPFVAEDGIMELFWQNGPVVVQSQNQRPLKKPPPARHADDAIPSGPSMAREIENRPSQQVENIHNQHVFMQEDEMASWIHSPIVDDSPLDHNFCADLCYSPPTINNNSNQINNSTMQTNVRTSQVTELRQPSRSVAPRPPIPPPKRPEMVHDSVHFPKLNARVEPGPSSSRTAARESTVVDSCDTPAAAAAAAAASGVSETVRSSAEPTEGDACRGSMSTTGVAAPSTTTAGGWTGGREAMACEMTETSSLGGSSGSAELAHKSPAADRKRKGREAVDSEYPSEDVYYESAEARKQVRRSKSTKRSRAAEVHNLSERRRRDRINEKMRALQELIPRCNKSDKASMLDEAIEYLKSLQLQVQMMCMGCGMVPMMYPGMQQYMPAMGMGMGMEMGMNRPVMPFPNMLATASAMPAATAAAHLVTRFPVPPFHMPLVAAPDLSRIQPVNQSDNMLTALAASDPTQSRIPNVTDSYHQYLGPHQMQLQLMQNQTMMQQNASKPSTSRGHENPENHQVRSGFPASTPIAAKFCSVRERTF